MSDLEKGIRERARELGAADVRFTTREIMSDGPPSADAAYVMPKAESVVSFMVPRDADAIPKFLAKEEYRPCPSGKGAQRGFFSDLFGKQSAGSSLPWVGGTNRR